MIAVLRIAASFFSIVALQRWMNWLAAALVLLALLNLKNDGVLVLLLPAAGLLAIVPAFCGGVALRYACTHSLLHLRPHGRTRLLLGATLVITLTAAIIAMPFQIQAWSVALGSMHRPALPSPAFIFQMAWTALAVLWLGMFLICRSQIAYAMFGVVPMILFFAARHLALRIEHFGWILPAGVLLWLAFAVWLMRTPQVARPAIMPSGATSDTHPFAWLMDVLPASPRNSASHATSLHLLGGGNAMFIVNGLWIALLFLVAQFGMSNTGRPRNNGIGLVLMLPFLAFMFATVGFMIVRRARLLWLRMGADRHALFRTAETRGLTAMGISWIIPAAAIVVSVAARGDYAATGLLLFYVLPALGLATAFFYGGMAMSHGLSVRDLLLGTGLAGLFVIYLFLLEPGHLADAQRALVTLGVTLAAALLLRALALRAWRRVDWRIAKLPPPSRRTT